MFGLIWHMIEIGALVGGGWWTRGKVENLGEPKRKAIK